MFNKLHTYYINQTFNPTFISIFLNPFYIIRKSLQKEIKKIAPHFTGKLLDFGCGTKPYKNLFTNVSEYIGVDIENEGHSHEKEQIDVFYDGKILPFENDYFDSLFCSEVFEHVFNIDEILPEIKRVLKNDAQILVTVPFIWDEHEIPNDFGRYTVYGLQHILKKHGFEILKVIKAGHYKQVTAQLNILYLRHKLYCNNKYLNMIINTVFISPFTIWGIIKSAILPKSQTLYFNSIVLAKKCS